VKTTCYRITLPDGREVVGPVLGMGGTLQGANGLDRLRIAARGTAHDSPVHGHAASKDIVEVFMHGEAVTVRIIGATVEIVEASK
jgi:hypothetical protein